MVLKTIVLTTITDRERTQTLSVGNQAALDTLLRRYHVDALLEKNDYSCEVSEYHLLREGGYYQLGDSFKGGFVELAQVSFVVKQHE